MNRLYRLYAEWVREGRPMYIPRKCPFCGRAAIERASEDGRNTFHYFRCTNDHDCGAMVSFTNTLIYNAHAREDSTDRDAADHHRRCWERRDG